LGIEMIGQEAQSWLGVPMVRGEQVIGVIAVQSYTTPRLYNEHHRDLLSAIANQAAIAIENARLFQETQERIQALSALYRAVQAVSTEFDLDTLTEKLIEEACRLVKADYGVLVTLDPATGAIQYFKISGIEPGRCPLTQLPQGKGLLRLLLEGQTTRVDDIRHHPSYSGHLPAEHLPIVSFLGLPLLYQNRVRGFLAVSNRATGPTFDQAAEDLLGTFAAQATVTLENARLFQETQARARREQILREITARVRGSTDPDAIVRTAVRELGTALSRPTFVRLGSAEQLSPIPGAQADKGDSQGTTQQGHRPELVEGGE
jgi:GAF domain-containing protein